MFRRHPGDTSRLSSTLDFAKDACFTCKACEGEHLLDREEVFLNDEAPRSQEEDRSPLAGQFPQAGRRAEVLWAMDRFRFCVPVPPRECTRCRPALPIEAP